MIPEMARVPGIAGSPRSGGMPHDVFLEWLGAPGMSGVPGIWNGKGVFNGQESRSGRRSPECRTGPRNGNGTWNDGVEGFKEWHMGSQGSERSL